MVLSEGDQVVELEAGVAPVFAAALDQIVEDGAGVVVASGSLPSVGGVEEDLLAFVAVDEGIRFESFR